MARARAERTAGSIRRNRLVVGIAALAAACATTGSRPAGREFVGGTALAPGEALQTLPDSATFAWVDPTNSIMHATLADDRHRDDPGIPALREDVAIVLRSHHWREVSADEAMYKLTIGRIDRPDPAWNAARTPAQVRGSTLPRCTGAVGERTDVDCTTRLPAIGNSDDASVTRYGAWLVFVIRRRDGAYYAASRMLRGVLGGDLGGDPGGDPGGDQELRDVDFAPLTLGLLRTGR